MTSLPFVGGPWDGRTYPLEKDQVKPLAVYVPESRGGHYALVHPDPKSLTQFAPHLLWRGK